MNLVEVQEIKDKTIENNNEYLIGKTCNVSINDTQNIVNHYIPFIKKLLGEKRYNELSKNNSYNLVGKIDNLSNDLHPHNPCSIIKYQFLNSNTNGISYTVYQFYYYTMTNCCGALNFSKTECYFNSLGIGSLLQYLKEDLAYKNNISYVSCTDKDNNSINKKILTTHGNYKIIDTFYNVKSNNNVNIYGKKLDKFTDKKIKEFKINLKN